MIWRKQSNLALAIVLALMLIVPVLVASNRAVGQNCNSQSCNDDCEDAIPIFDGSTGFDTTAATSSTNFIRNCGADNQQQTVADVWYDYTATCTGVLEAAACDTTFVSVISIHDLGEVDDCSLVGGSTLIGSRCSECRATARVTAGHTYKLQVGGNFVWWWSNELPLSGSGMIEVECCAGEDCDGNGVADGCDGLYDLDGSGGIDLRDVAMFTTCFSGVEPVDPACDLALIDCDDDVDEADWQFLSQSMTGP